MDDIKIPVKITPDPIINAVIEVRFIAGIPEKIWQGRPDGEPAEIRSCIHRNH